MLRSEGEGFGPPIKEKRFNLTKCNVITWLQEVEESTKNIKFVCLSFHLQRNWYNADREESTGDKRYIGKHNTHTHTQVMREREREREEWIVNHKKKIINNRIMNQYQNVM